jgi:anti-sigma regulatory factor (Ser/Thr protein kinase)
MSDHLRLLISFVPAFENINMVRSAVKGVCTDFFKLPETSPSIMDFCLIICELMNNAVEHSHADMLTAEIILSDYEATFRLISRGPAFDPTTAAVMPNPEHGEELAEGGYGLAIIQSLADGMEYEHREDRNMVSLRKTFALKAGKGQ